MVVKFSTAPKHDEIEFTVFGPGVGESSLLHYGDNEWLIVDCGVTFKDATALGSDVFMPSIEAIS